MNAAHCPHPGLPVVLPLYRPAWLRWRDALASAWSAWRRRVQARQLRDSLRDVDARTLCDIGLGEFAARPSVTLSTLDWERGRW